MTRPTYTRDRDSLKTVPPVTWYRAKDGMERAVMFTPGFSIDPRYGRAAMRLTFMLRGPKGVTQFVFSTGWTPEKVQRASQFGVFTEWMHSAPTGFDVGYHARIPQYEGAEQYGDQPCPFLEAECWYDGSGLAADVVLAEFFDRGEIAVWEALQARYDDLITERNPIMSEEPTSAAADDITDAGDQTPIPVPTLREQIETHLWYAHDTDNTTALVHLAIAAGIGLASTTLDDISDQNDARDAAAQQFTNYPISALRGAL